MPYVDTSESTLYHDVLEPHLATDDLQQELVGLNAEVNVVAGLIEDCIKENAHVLRPEGIPTPGKDRGIIPSGQAVQRCTCNKVKNYRVSGRPVFLPVCIKIHCQD